MSQTLRFGICVLFAAAIPWTVGCRSQQPEAEEAPAVEVEEVEVEEVGADDQAAAAEIQEALAELSDEDRAIVLTQAVCPVSDQPLGEMGVPIKVDVNGHAVFICCEGCRDELLTNADQYLAQLDLVDGSLE